MLVWCGVDLDFVKVFDFGLAKLIEGAAGGALSVAALTQNDMVFGTPEYMAPEQAMGHALDGRADLYAVGATLFEMLTGRPPFVDAAPMKLLAMHVKAPPPPLRAIAPDLAVPDALEALIARCLAKTPEGRPQSASELAAALRALEPQLSSVPTRVPAAVASSATVDLDTPSPLSGAQTAIAPRPPPPSSAGTDVIRTRGLRRSTRTLIVLLAVGGVGATAVIAFALTRSRPRDESPAPAAATLIDARIEAPIEAAIDAAVAIAADAAPAPDARTAVTGVSGDRTKKPEAHVAAKADDELAVHLAAAERARRAGNRLRQLAEADAALERDPRHVRARFLMGEALLETGDAANGCRYLRSAKRVAEARALLGSGRCPAD